MVKDTCEPVYEESFTYDLEPSWLDSVSLEVSVVDRKGIFARSPLMGRAVVPLSQPGVASASGVTEWHDLVSSLFLLFLKLKCRAYSWYEESLGSLDPFGACIRVAFIFFFFFFET